MNPEKTIVIYKTKYGAAKTYAEWIAEDLGCKAFNMDDIRKDILDDYDLIIYGGGVHAGGIRGFDVYEKWLKKYLFWTVDKTKKFICFAVGMNVNTFEARAELRNINFGKDWLRDMTCYYFEGSYDPAKLKGIDKAIIKMTRNMLVGGGELNLASDKIELLNKIDNGYSNVTRDQIAKLVCDVKAM